MSVCTTVVSTRSFWPSSSPSSTAACTTRSLIALSVSGVSRLKPRWNVRRTRQAHLEHEGAKAELKKLVPEDAKEAVGHGIKAKRSKSGAISFDLADEEAGHAPIQ